MHLLAAFAGRDTRDNALSANLPGIRVHETDMELTLLAGCPLHENSRIFVTVDHAVTSTAFFTTRSIVSSIS